MAYQPLDTTKNEIRLLKIDTTIPVLRCTLTHHSLSANAPSPTYSALSYAWGPVGDTHDIVVNGCPTLATHSLYTALLQLGDDSPGYLWVDALCINQRDIAEKTSQIQRMGEIYSGAEQVVAWLGPATLNSQNAFCLIERLWREIFDPMYTAEEKAGQSLGNQEWVKYCRAMGQLCQLPYWRRTWIIQEIALARGLVFRCGQLRCVGTHLFNALDVSPFGTFGTERTENWTDVVNGEEYEAMETVRGLMRFTKEWGSGRKPLLECLFLAAHMRSEASDPRDRVYGMLGIATDGLELVPSPGYEAQNTLQAMLKNLTTSYINTKGGLDIILCRNREEISKEETPSWVPDYTSFSKSVPRHLTGILTNSRSFNCTPGLHNSEKENYRLDGNLLNAKVLLWDTVANIGATREIYEKEPYFVDIAKSLANKNLPTPNDELVQAQLTSLKNPYTSGSNAYQAILTTIIRDQEQNIDRRLMGGALKNLWNKPEEFHRCLLDVNATYTVADTMNWLAQNSSFKVCGRSLQEWTEEEEKEEDDGIPENKKVALMRYVQNIIASTFYARRRLVTTEKGYIGNAHGSARVGDKVALMAGCSVPVLLRQEGGQTGFEVVGDVYVSSIMWGEKYANILGMAEWESVEIH